MKNFPIRLFVKDLYPLIIRDSVIIIRAISRSEMISDVSVNFMRTRREFISALNGTHVREGKWKAGLKYCRYRQIASGIGKSY